MNYVEQIAVGLFVIGVILLFIIRFLSKLNHNVPKLRGVKNPKFAVMIPIQKESKKMSQLLESIKKQTFTLSMKDVYLIVNSKEELMVQMEKEYGVTILEKPTLKGKRKGEILDEGIKDILDFKKHYDAYFIFDADDILDENYFYEMVKVYDMGYDIGSGYRNCKNVKTIIGACSCVMENFINDFRNEKKNKSEQNIILIASGFYIRGEWVEKWGEYPFQSFAEDYELSLYAIEKEMTTYYNKNAILYVKQPSTYKEWKNQGKQWIQGYFDVRKKYIGKLLKKLNRTSKNKGSIIGFLFGFIPYIFMILGIFLFLGGSCYFE